MQQSLDLSMPSFSIDEFKGGDSDVFGQFYHRFYRTSCYFAKQIVGDGEVGRDIVAEVFIRIWKNRERFDPANGLQDFLYVSIKNACLNYIKQAKVAKEYIKQFSGQVVVGRNGDPVLNGIYYKEVRKAIARAIDLLPAQCRRVIKLSLDGMSTDEIATHLNLSPQTIRNTKGRARVLLRSLLDEDMISILALQRAIEMGLQN